jgi:hypothetical protein
MPVLREKIIMTKPTPEQEAENHNKILLFRWEWVCKTEAPYPLNYLPSSEKPEHKMMGILIGMMIEKGMFRE